MLKNPSSSSKLNLVAGHLNAATGPIVSPTQLARTLRDGSVRHVLAGPHTKVVRGLLHTLFVEVDPSLIMGCVREVGSTWRAADHLYQEALADGMPHVTAWERAVAGWK